MCVIAYVKSLPISLSGVQTAASIVVPLALVIAAFALLVGDTTTACADERTSNGARSVCADVPSRISVAGVVLLVAAVGAGGAYASTSLGQQQSGSSQQVPTAQR